MKSFYLFFIIPNVFEIKPKIYLIMWFLFWFNFFVWFQIGLIFIDYFLQFML